MLFQGFQTGVPLQTELRSTYLFFSFFNHLTFEENILLRLNLLVFPIEELMVTLLLVQVSIEILGSSFIYLIYCRYIKSSPTYKNILEKNLIRSYYQIDS